MLLSERFMNLFQTNIAPSSQIHIKGWDISEKAVRLAKENGFDARVQDISLPLENDENLKYDMILFFEVLEHLVDTDTAIRNIHALLKSNGILVMSTPNLASWYNRIFLLFGNQPHCAEVSYAPIRFGNRLTHKLLGETEGKTEIAAGHLHIFTWKALREFLGYFGFNIFGAKGCANHKYDLISRIVCPIWPGLSGDICVVARKTEANKSVTLNYHARLQKMSHAYEEYR